MSLWIRVAYAYRLLENILVPVHEGDVFWNAREVFSGG